MAEPHWNTNGIQSLRFCLIAPRAISLFDFAQLKLLLVYLFVLSEYLYCLLTCDNSLRLFAKLTNFPDMAMRYAEKHKTPRLFDEGGVLCGAKRLRR